VTIVLRREEPPAPATLAIHMGAGAVDTVVNAALRNYGEYREVTDDGLGIFAVSVFAVAAGVTEATILDALPQRSFARSTVGRVSTAGFALLPTSVVDPELAADIAAIQHVHFDIVLPAIEDERLAATDPLDDEDLELLVRSHLHRHAERLLALFGERVRR
jgi:hypothetical protein